MCNGGLCKYEHKFKNEVSEMNYSVYVVGKTLLYDGYSETQKCNDRSIQSKKCHIRDNKVSLYCIYICSVFLIMKVKCRV